MRFDALRFAGRSALPAKGAPEGAGRDRLALPLAAGAAVGAAMAARTLLMRVLLLKLRRDVRALNRGDYRSLLSAFADDAVLRFNDGEHRWAGEHRGKAAIERFLKNFVAAGVEGEIVELFAAGPPWRMTLLVRFDDHAHDPAGAEIYRNRTLLLVRARWGRIVRQEDFYEDTERIVRLERRLVELGVPAVG
jgi:ketosteroid isomerase-like protein